MLRKQTGLPWSWNFQMPVAASVFSPPGVTPCNSRLSWIATPLCFTVTRALAVFLPSAWNFGAVKSMSYVCYASGGRHMFTFGLAAL